MCITLRQGGRGRSQSVNASQPRYKTRESLSASFLNAQALKKVPACSKASKQSKLSERLV